METEQITQEAEQKDPGVTPVTPVEEKLPHAAPEDNSGTVVADETGNSEAVPEIETETPEQINWKKFRDERKADREREKAAQEKAAQKEEEARALQMALDRVLEQKGAPMTAAEEQQIVDDLADDDIPMGRDIKSYLAKHVDDMVEKRLAARDAGRKEEEAKRQQQEMPDQLRKNHENFDGVMTQDNFDYLEYHHPEVAQAIGYMPNGYDKWTNAYKLIKKLVPNATTAKQESQRVQQNLAKPQAAAGALGQPSGDYSPGRSLTEAEKAANYKRLRDLARGA